jgi:hypothetical protein
MKIINDLLSSRIVKLVAFVLVVYFALFSNKEHPDSLGNRLSSEKIKENFNQIKERSGFVISNIQTAKNGIKDQKDIDQENQFDKQKIEQITQNENFNDDKSFSSVTSNDIEIGSGQEIENGNKVEISYSIFSEKDEQLKFKNSEIILVDQNSYFIFERYSFGMKVGGIRSISLPYNFQTDDQRILQFLKKDYGQIKIQITLKNIHQK